MNAPRVSGIGVACLVVLALALPRASLVAQVGTSTEIITGRVVGPDSAPLFGARVDITSLTTNVVRHTVTRSDGRFTVLFRDGGGQYRMAVTFVGMQPARIDLARQGDEDRLAVNVVMSANAQTLAVVEVRARQNAPSNPGASNAGGTGRNLPAIVLERLPMDRGDLASIASLVPGVVPVGGTDSSGASFSVAAQPPTQNNISVDGLSFLFGSVPQDAVRSAAVTTNVYDVSRGQFVGGLVTVTTKSGGSLFEAASTYTAHARDLQFAGSPSRAFPQDHTQHVVSGGAGGPILGSEHAFYFASAQVERRTDDLLSLVRAEDAVLGKLGASADSVRRFLALVDRNGIGTTFRAPFDRTNTNGSALVRVDLDLADNHALMLRGDVRQIDQSASRVAPLALPGTGGSMRERGAGGMAALTSSLGSWVNEARAYVATDHQDTDPYLRVPAGVVASVSSRADGAQQVANLQFGGNAALPRALNSTLAEAGDELSWLSPRGSHRVKLGVLLDRNRVATGVGSNQYGTFLYNSLADFDAGRPALFGRALSGVARHAGSDNTAFYVGDAWRPSTSLQVTYGSRIERTTLAGAPADNPAVDAAFHRSTSFFPIEVAIAPRLGFTYLIGNLAGVANGVMRGGIGAFRGTVPAQLVGAVSSSSGLPDAQTQLVCAGSAVPTPAWSAYLADPSTIPTTCAGSSGGTTAARPNVVLFAPSFAAPLVWRASFGLSRRVFERFSLGLDGMLVYGTNVPDGTDLNLVAQPLGAVAAEGGRPLFAAASAIDPRTGAVGLAPSRLHPDFGTVLSVAAQRRSRAAQTTMQFVSPVGLGYLSLSYTFVRALDQTNGYPFGNGLATTAGDPRQIEWGTSDLEHRHNMLAVLLVPVPHSLEVSLIARALSGQRYTPLVNGDVNGDGVRNDRAFVFAPGATTDTAVSNGMQRLLGSADGRARACLESQFGRVAGRNSCTTPWASTFDLQLSYRPARFGLDRRVTASLVLENLSAGVDALVHGADGLHGWGQPVIPDRLLLNVRAFNPATSAWAYQVNSHFGSSSGTSSAFRVPFQLGLQLHVTLGNDPQRAMMRSVYGTPDGRPPAPDVLKARILRQFPNPIQAALDVADSLELGLTADQRARIVVLNDGVKQRADTIMGALASTLSAAGANPDPGQIGPRILSTQSQALQVVQQAISDLRAALTPAQWAKLPNRVRFPLQFTIRPF